MRRLSRMERAQGIALCDQGHQNGLQGRACRELGVRAHGASIGGTPRPLEGFWPIRSRSLVPRQEACRQGTLFCKDHPSLGMVSPAGHQAQSGKTLYTWSGFAECSTQSGLPAPMPSLETLIPAREPARRHASRTLGAQAEKYNDSTHAAGYLSHRRPERSPASRHAPASLVRPDGAAPPWAPVPA